MTRQMKIKALKYGDRLHYEWETALLERMESHIFVFGEYGRKLRHHTKQQVFTISNRAIEYFSTQDWFTVSADVTDGTITQYYCNINQPAKIAEDTVSFVDLDLDLVWREGEWKVIDEDEFASNAIRFNYPEALIRQAVAELAGLQERIRERHFPFDGSIERLIERIPVHNSVEG